MIIKLGPQQIPIFWEAIKTATTIADEVDDYPPYLNKMLHDLLNDKNQCFVRLTDKRILVGILVTQINESTAGKSLHIKTLYSWQQSHPSDWQTDFLFIKEFALHEKCSRITFESRNQRVWDLGLSLGFKEATRLFSLEVV